MRPLSAIMKWVLAIILCCVVTNAQNICKSRTRPWKYVNVALAMKQQMFLQKSYVTEGTISIRDAVSMGDSTLKICQYFAARMIKTPLNLQSFSPDEILQGMIKTVMRPPLNANTLIFLTRNDFRGTNTAAGKYLIKLANSIGLPVITWTADNPGLAQEEEDSIIVDISPTMSHQALAMAAILRRYKWQTFSVITTKRVGQNQFINTLRRIVEEEKHTWFEIIEIVQLTKADEDSVRKNLEKIKASDTRIILMFALYSEADTIFKIAKEVGLTSPEYMWIVTKSVVAETLSSEDGDKEEEQFTIAEYQKWMVRYPTGTLGISYETSVGAFKKAVADAAKIWVLGMNQMVESPNFDPKTNFLTPNVSTLSLGDVYWKDGVKLNDAMRNASDPITGERLFKDDGTLRNIQLEIVNWVDGNWRKVGDWSEEKNLEMKDITWPGRATQPPAGKPSTYHLKVITMEEDPYVKYSNPDNITGTCSPGAQLCRIAKLNETIGVANATTNSSLYKCCSGYCIDLLKQISVRLGFTTELFRVEDGKWGAPDAKGNWNGIPRALLDRKGDLAMTSLKINPERSRVLDFSVPFLETGITIIVAIRDGAISPTAFLEPYDLAAWLMIILMYMCLMSSALFVCELITIGYLRKPKRREGKLEPYDYPSWCLILVFSVHAIGAAIFIVDWLSPDGMNQGKRPIREHRFSLFRAFWLIWAMLFAASVNTDNPRGVSGRFMASVWALFAVVFLASYTANLAAFMIAKEVYYDLSGIKDDRLLNPYQYKPPLKFATVPFGSTEINLKRNYREMYKYMIPYNKSNVDEGIKSVKKGDIDAFIYDASVLNFKAAHDDGCKLRTVGKVYAMTGYGVAFPRGSKWLKRFNEVLIDLSHDGTLERLRKFWLRGACKASSDKGDQSHPLEIKNFTSAFILLAGGMLLGVVLLFLEHCYFMFVRPQLRQWDKGGYCGLISLSMGKSLTFQESVMETTEMIRHHHCKNPVCETQLWKAKHELDIAQIQLNRLGDAMKQHGVDTNIRQGNEFGYAPRIPDAQDDMYPSPRRMRPPAAGFIDAGPSTSRAERGRQPPEPPSDWMDSQLPQLPQLPQERQPIEYVGSASPRRARPDEYKERADDILYRADTTQSHPQKRRRHKGNTYHDIKEDKVEKESCL